MRCVSACRQRAFGLRRATHSRIGGAPGRCTPEGGSGHGLRQQGSYRGARGRERQPQAVGRVPEGHRADPACGAGPAVPLPADRRRAAGAPGARSSQAPGTSSPLRTPLSSSRRSRRCFRRSASTSTATPSTTSSPTRTSSPRRRTRSRRWSATTRLRIPRTLDSDSSASRSLIPGRRSASERSDAGSVLS